MIPAREIFYNSKRITEMTNDELIEALTSLFNAFVGLKQRMLGGEGLPTEREFIEALRRKQ